MMGAGTVKRTLANNAVRFGLAMLLGISLLSVSAACSRKRDPSQPAPPSKFAEEMNSYVGESSSKLLARLGVPDARMSLDEGKVLYEWYKEDFGVTLWRYVRYSKCEIRVVINADDIVETWNSSGSCR